jgi:hypothetical protein
MNKTGTQIEAEVKKNDAGASAATSEGWAWPGREEVAMEPRRDAC